MDEKFLDKGIYKVKFGYHSKMGGYMTLMSDIPKMLCSKIKEYQPLMVGFRKERVL